MAIRNIQIERPKSLSRMVAEEIKVAILNGVLKPGDKLVETELTQSLGVSRTPLREAFRELAVEGYITVIPHKGSYVSTISEGEVTGPLLHHECPRRPCHEAGDSSPQKRRGPGEPSRSL
ncbi:MAG: GntR family transcriptional regulator [Nitrospinaceae bacterium]|jgi:DNA-binding GntR family transcriptional regulator|nr:GntR family transcriptional regulator [Nitrospinaceae bacterium]